jgi:hypothetical protein
MPSVRDHAVWLVAVIAVAVLLAVAARQFYAGQRTLNCQTAGREGADSTAAAAPATPDGPTPQARLAAADLLDAGGTVQVEVLNGCGAAQAASRLTRRARSLGLDVIDEGNADGYGYVESMVVDRRGHLGKARAVADLLGIPVCIQQVTDHPSVLAEVSIVIGRDHGRLGLLGP